MSEPDTKQRAWDLVLAIIIATIVFSTLSVVIKIEPQQAIRENTSPDAGIFSLDSDPEKCSPRHVALVKWLEYKDPTHVTLPPEEGLNRDHPSRNWIYRDSEFFGKTTSLPPVTPPLIEQEPYVFQPRLPVSPSQATKQQLTLQSLTRIQFPAIPPPPPAPEPGIYWLDEKSRTIINLPVLPIADIEAEGRKITGPTYLQVTPLGNGDYQPRVSVEMSCGERTLDLIAFRHLARWLRRLTVQKSNPLRESWLMTPRQIAVVWRHVPGIMYRPPKGTLEDPVADEPDAG